MLIKVEIINISESIDQRCKCEDLASFSIRSEFNDGVNMMRKQEDRCSRCATDIQFLMEQLAEHLGL